MTSKSIIFSVLGASVAGGTIAGGVLFMQPTNIKELLISKGLKLLDIDGGKNDKEWKKLIDRHTGVEITISTTNKIPTIKGFTLNGSDDNQKIKQLKDKCKELFEKPISQKSEFEDNTKNWCTLESPVLKEEQKVVPAKLSNMAEFIKEKGWTQLDKGDESSDKTKWEALVSKYSTISEPNKKITINNFKNGDINKGENVKALQAACDALLKSTENFENNAETVRDWCTKQTTLTT